MTIARSEDAAAFSLEKMPAEERPREERSGPTVGSVVLAHLRAAWSDYQSDNKRGWAKLVDEQARDPTLD